MVAVISPVVASDKIFAEDTEDSPELTVTASFPNPIIPIDS